MADQRGIADLYASEAFDDVAYELNDDFLRLKHTLVSQRKEKKTHPASDSRVPRNQCAMGQ